MFAWRLLSSLAWRDLTLAIGTDLVLLHSSESFFASTGRNGSTQSMRLNTHTSTRHLCQQNLAISLLWKKVTNTTGESSMTVRRPCRLLLRAAPSVVGRNRVLVAQMPDSAMVMASAGVMV